MVKRALSDNDSDTHFMAIALSLGMRNRGLTWPNPSVGAVLVQQTSDGPKIIAQGVTARGGRPHAERVALEVAGEAARGATLYVTLEPCSHMGRDTPCSDCIIEAGISRVVTGAFDPDHRVAGEGFKRLQDAGIDLVTGVLEGQAHYLHRGHLMRCLKKRPFITVKMARTRDGYAGSGTSERLMITSADANARTHMVRAHADAILIGVSTANADDPRLDVRLPGMADRSPVRVVFDSALTINPALGLIRTARQLPTWIVTTENADEAKVKWLTEQGIEVIRVKRGVHGRLDPAMAMTQLYERGISTVLCEGGPTVAQTLCEADLADEIILVTASHDYGAEGLKAVLPGMQRILEQRFRPVKSEMVGPDEFVFYEKAE